MGKEPHGGSAGTSQTPGQPQAIPDVRSARAAESARPRHGANDAGQRGLGLYGQASHFTPSEEGDRKVTEEDILHELRRFHRLTCLFLKSSEEFDRLDEL